MAISKLLPAHVEAMHGALRRSGMGPGTIRVAHSILRRALAVAVKRRIVPYNVCDQVGRPSSAGAEMQSLTQQQAADFLAAAADDRLYALYVLAITTGLRGGELFGLKRDDIDLAAGTLTVQRTLCRLNGDFVENPPKSKAGCRQVSLPAVAVGALRTHYKRMLAEGNAGSAYVFCNHLGGPLWRTNVRRKSLRPILKAAGLPMIRFHDLRHTSATLLLASGENVKTIQQRAWDTAT